MIYHIFLEKLAIITMNVDQTPLEFDSIGNTMLQRNSVRKLHDVINWLEGEFAIMYWRFKPIEIRSDTGEMEKFMKLCPVVNLLNEEVAVRFALTFSEYI